jgi:PAS domain S-box-containing protein
MTNNLSVSKKFSKYKILVENIQEMVIFFDSDGRIIDYNSKAAGELGYAEDLYEIPFYDIFKNVIIYEDNQYKINQDYCSKMQETVAYRKNQTCFPVELKITFLKKKKGFIALCTAINISDKKDAIRELSHLKGELKNFDQMSSEFVAMITHELRTPVNGVMGFSNNLLEMDLKPDQMEAVNIIKRCCVGMNMLINDLLDYAKIINNRFILEQREFGFRNMIRQMIEVNRIKINEKGLKLLVDISNDIPDRVVGDELRLTQILTNLFSNAIKFTQVGQVGLKVVKVLQNDHNIDLFFMVFDSGIGISREEKDKLFKSFSQVDQSITRRFGGTGLGLAISKKLVEAMHGTIDVDSEKGKGSTFTFSVRLGLPESIAEEAEDTNGDTDITDQNNVNLYNSEEESTGLSENDYISMTIKEANITTPAKVGGIEAMREAMIIMNDLIEKLTICIEMENWKKAEELAYNMKKLIPQDHNTNSKNFFYLLQCVRKENYHEAVAILNEIKLHMYKEK